MKVTVHDLVPATADVSAKQVEAYLARSGWTNPRTLLGRGATGRVWTKDDRHVHIWSDDGARELGHAITCIAADELRPASAVLADVVGFEILNRGTAIVNRSSAMARVVDARGTLSRIPAHRAADRETARVRLVQTEAEAERATRSLRAAEGAI